jgi:hypothetical protein
VIELERQTNIRHSPNNLLVVVEQAKKWLLEC